MYDQSERETRFLEKSMSCRDGVESGSNKFGRTVGRGRWGDTGLNFTSVSSSKPFTFSRRTFGGSIIRGGGRSNSET